MTFPITRKDLQNYPEQFRKEQEYKRIQAAIEYVTDQILSSASRNGMNGEQRLQIWTKHIQVSSEKYSVLINALKDRFPDTDIQIDPMKTYLLIDWS